MSTFELVDPGVDSKGLSCLPSLFERVGLAKVFNLANHVEFAEAIELSLVWKGSQGLGIFAEEFTNRLNPFIDDAEGLSVDGVLDAAATVVTAEDDMFYLEGEDGVMEDREEVGVVWGDEVCDVAVYEEFTRLQAGDRVGWDTAVGTADPEEFGALAFGLCFKDAGFAGFATGRPVAVIFE